MRMGWGGDFVTKQGGGFYFHGPERGGYAFYGVTLHYMQSIRFVDKSRREGEGEGGRRGEKRSQGHAFLGRQDVEGHLGPPSPLPCSVYGPIALLTVVVFCFLADSRRCDY